MSGGRGFATGPGGPAVTAESAHAVSRKQKSLREKLESGTSLHAQSPIANDPSNFPLYAQQVGRWVAPERDEVERLAFHKSINEGEWGKKQAPVEQLERFVTRQKEKMEATQFLQLGSQLIDDRDPRTQEHVSNIKKSKALFHEFFPKG